MPLPDLQAALWAWVQSLPAWQSDLVRRLSTIDRFDQAAVDEAVLVILGAFKVPTDSPTIDPVPLPALVAPALPLVAAKITALSDLVAVGSVEPGQRLEFGADGITLVFGETGSGKSSYARVLRKACRASNRSVEILPNVLSTGPGINQKKAGTAKIDVLAGGVTNTIARDVNAVPEPSLAQVSVFDADCADVYADGESEITYTPPSLRLFERLVTLQTRIKQRLEEDVSRLNTKHFQTDDFDPTTKAGALVLALTENVNPDTVRALASITDEDRRRLEDLRAQMSPAIVDPSKVAVDLSRQADAATRLAAEADVIDAGLSAKAVAELQSLNTALDELARRSTEFSEVISRTTARPVGSASWKSMWQAAHVYVGQHGGDPFPPRDGENDVTCPLCQQALGVEAADRLRRLEDFFVGEVEKRIRDSSSKRARVVDSIGAVADGKSLLAQAVVLLGDNSDLLQVVTRFAESVAPRRTAIIQLAKDTTRAVPSLATSPATDLSALATELRRRSEEQAALAMPETRARLVHEVAELENRIRLAERLQPVLDRIDTLKKLTRLRSASSALTTTGLSRKIGELTEGAVTAQLRARLTQELEALHVAHLPIMIGSRGEKGKTQVRLQLNATRQAAVSDVLSEGERRAVALAFFLAEVAVAEHGGAIILDDPVSSLDHSRRSYVAQRLVEEARKRQSIVFTHDVVFFLELQDIAKRGGTPFELRIVRRVGDSSGVATTDLPWVAQNVGQRIKFLRAEIQRLGAVERKGNADTYRREIKVWFELLREAWERTVEEKLFNGVVTRFQPGIQTLRLRPVTVTTEMTTAIEEGMTLASNWTHDQAPALNRPPPPASDLETELERLNKFVGQFKN